HGISFEKHKQKENTNPYYHPRTGTYGLHTPPPYSTPSPPPIQYHTHYNACNYTNPFVGRPYYAPLYTCHPNASFILQPRVMPTPPPTHHQQPKKINTNVNVHKDSIFMELDENNPNQHLVSFVFDALVDGSITIYYFAREEPNCVFNSLYPQAYMPMKIPFHKGLDQRFRQPPGTGINLGFFQFDDLSKPSAKEDLFPLVISAETYPYPVFSDGNFPDPYVSPHTQITQAVIENNMEGSLKVKVIKQILWVDGVRYELRELYGIGNMSQGLSSNDCCVICMTEPKDTALLPCRHMCMCNECAKALRLESDKCPICRQPIEELLEIKLDNVDQQL
ncbi:hypothetical protein Leryth_026466, partial [Lithospermum erythrorhizon]